MVKMKLAEIRNKMNLTQKDLADLLNVSASTVAMWETNKRTPDIKLIINICYLLHCKIENLYPEYQEVLDMFKPEIIKFTKN